MSDKDLRKMKRLELIEIIYALQEREVRLEAHIAKLEAQLEDRRIVIEEAGSIAEAALQLNGVFAAAQAAADQYLTSLKGQKGEVAFDPKQ